MITQEKLHNHMLDCEEGNQNKGCAGIKVRISHQLEDLEWDRFLQETTNGHYGQSSLWAQLKAQMGWGYLRLLIKQEEELIAGAQILTRSIPFLGKIGYIPKGPLCKTDDSMVNHLIIKELNTLAKTQSIHYLLIQPPSHHAYIIDELLEADFKETPICVSPTATSVVDLTQNEEDLLSAMKVQTRQNILRSQRRGITIREGKREDLENFYTLLSQTSKRGGFSMYPMKYFTEMHRIFNACHGIKLLFAEYLDEIVSSVLLIAFRDTVYCKYAAWSGKHGDCRPNEGIHWAAMRWAKSQGYHYYDFEGIDEDVARIKLRGEKVPKSKVCPISRFKLGFRGTIQICPCAYDQVYKPMLSLAYRRILPGMKNSTFFMKIVDHVRVTASNLFLPKSNFMNSILNG